MKPISANIPFIYTLCYEISLKALVAGKQLPAPWLQEIIFLPIPSFFISTENALPTKIHFLNLPVILHLEPPNFLPLPAQEPLGFLFSISQLLLYSLFFFNWDESVLPHQKWHQISWKNILGEEGEKQNVLVRVTKYFKDDGKLKCTDFYLNSLEFKESGRFEMSQLLQSRLKGEPQKMTHLQNNPWSSFLMYRSQPKPSKFNSWPSYTPQAPVPSDSQWPRCFPAFHTH